MVSPKSQRSTIQETYVGQEVPTMASKNAEQVCNIIQFMIF